MSGSFRGQFVYQGAFAWAMRCRCLDCGGAFMGSLPSLTRTRSDLPLVPWARAVCSWCGGTGFADPCPGRAVSASVWWDPRTWGTVRWEWRQDLSEPLSTPD